MQLEIMLSKLSQIKTNFACLHTVEHRFKCHYRWVVGADHQSKVSTMRADEATERAEMVLERLWTIYAMNAGGNCW